MYFAVNSGGKMNKTTFIAGMVAGMVMGSAVSMVVMPMNKQKSLKKGANKAFKTLGSVIDSIIE